MSMNEFFFGTLSTLEKRVAYAQELHKGVRHRSQLAPQAPRPGEQPTITVDVELSQSIERVVCKLLQPEQATIELKPVDTSWDLLNWSYYQRWQAALPAYNVGTIVRYVIHAHPAHGGEPIPADNGEHFSYLVGEPGAPPWAHEAIVYQIFPDRFHPGRGRRWNNVHRLDEIYGGTLRGIIEHLDYIADLGFNCIWLNPFFPDKTHHRYHATDYFQVEPELGTLDDIREFVQEAHARDIRVLLDFVANHWGREHPTFQAALRDPNSEYRDWYFWESWPDEYRSYFGIRDLPKINVDHPGARNYLLRAAEYWLREIDFDGYRLDYALGPSDDFWTAFRATVKAARPDAWIFGEVVETATTQRRYDGRFDGTLDVLLMQALRDTFAFGTMDVAAFDAFIALHEQYFPAHFSRPSFLDNHDVNRFLWLTKGDKRKVKLAALCQFTLSGPPIVYYGTEVGLSQARDIVQERGHIMEESRQPMVWGDAQDRDLHQYYRWLIHFRREHPVLWRGERQTVHLDKTRGTYSYMRRDSQETVLVALNASDTRQTVEAAGHTFDLEPWSGDIRLINH